MKYCYKCGISETNTVLMEAISHEGIVNICGYCSKKDNIPIVKAGISPREEETEKSFSQKARQEMKIQRIDFQKRKEMETENESLRKIVDRNIRHGFKEDLDTKSLLVRNFHWVLLRARRSKKLTQGEFAKLIHEPELNLKMLERGLVPERSRELILKIERTLGVYLRENPEPEDKRNIASRISEEDIDFSNFDDLILSELKELSEEEERK